MSLSCTLAHPPSPQVASVPEVLAFVLNHLKRRRKRNVLTFGYRNAVQGDAWDPFRFHGTVSQSAALIGGSDLWAKVNQRLGTEVTRYLLQECAVFALAPPSCVVQVCGVPLYDLVPVRVWSGFFTSAGPPCGTRTSTRRTRGDRDRGHLARKARRGTAGKKREVEKEGGQGSGTPPGGRTKDLKDTKKRKREEGGEGGRRDEDKRRRLDAVGQGDSCYGDAGPPPTETGGAGSLLSEWMEPVSAVPTPREGVLSWKPSDQAPSRPSHCFVRVLSMLYGGRGMKGFLLNRKVGGAQRLQGADLVRIIFLQGNTCLSGAEPKPRKLPKRFFSMVPLFSRLLRQHHKCPYHQFLRRKCSGGDGEDMASLLASHCAPYRVYLFLRDCLSAVVPEQLWGSRHNQLLFLSQVKHFLWLGRFDSVSLGQVTWRIHTRDCSWLGHGTRTSS